MNFSIVSNTCSSCLVYGLYYPEIHSSFIEYNNPFISSWFPDDECYLRLCENYDYYMSLTPRFDLPPVNLIFERDTGSKTYLDKRSIPTYVIMFLGDVEIHRIHETNVQQLIKKFNCRKEISKGLDHIFLWSDAEMINIHSDEERRNLINRFTNINKKSIFLTQHKEEEMENHNTIIKYIPEWKDKSQYDRDKIFKINWYSQPDLGKLYKTEIDRIIK